MAQAKRKTANKPQWQIHYRLREGAVILLTAISLFLFLSLFTYHGADPGWSKTGAGNEIVNLGGYTGAWFADVFFYLIGYVAYLFPIMIGAWAYAVFKQRQMIEEPRAHLLLFRGIGFFGSLLAGCALAHLYLPTFSEALAHGSGGALGQMIATQLVQAFNPNGATLFLAAVFLACVTFATGLSWLSLADTLGQRLLEYSNRTYDKLKKITQKYWARYADYRADKWVQETVKPKIVAENPIEPRFNFTKKETPVPAQVVVMPKVPMVISPPVVVKASKRPQQQIPLFDSENALPSISLLDAPVDENFEAYTPQMLEVLSKQVEETLADFGVLASVVAVHPGPVITRFELELAPGIKASKITGLARDIARSLSMVSVRVVEIIPGKSVVGLELPNIHRQTVALSDVLSSQVYEKCESPLSLALGKDIAGHPVVVDLAKMPHLLVAGTTGAGKSVGLNAMLLSMLFKAGPDEVRFIMIDPKMLELSVYDGIPHLLTPVVTDMKEAANALRWCVAEMERRYRLMAALGVRNLTGYNRKVMDAIKNKTPILDPLWPEENEQEAPELGHLPYIVVVVDEFADMIMVVGKKVEELIARIAQKARAAGIHLILATQRPSVDVITGLIKANVPARIAFQVASRIDSRTILDQQGAEQLLGRGDMLYLPVGAGLPVRVHGAFVSDQEVHAVANDWKNRGTPEYQDDILSGSVSEQTFNTFSAGIELDDEDDGKDSLYDQAVQIVIESRKASISSIQRRLRIGYNRAARLVEQMEADGLVSAVQANGSREVLAKQG
jgi:S-DNA-T family DNA segregation ATPase FtsK/SpoIIIE